VGWGDYLLFFLFTAWFFIFFPGFWDYTLKKQELKT